MEVILAGSLHLRETEKKCARRELAFPSCSLAGRTDDSVLPGGKCRRLDRCLSEDRIDVSPQRCVPRWAGDITKGVKKGNRLSDIFWSVVGHFKGTWTVFRDLSSSSWGNSAVLQLTSRAQVALEIPYIFLLLPPWTYLLRPRPGPRKC